MTNLILESLAIRGFRAFRQLQIERLGRVNLIVGKNNVGKSCLLEALWLYARRGSPSLIAQLLEARDEISRLRLRSSEREEDQTWNIKHLFHGRQDITAQTEPIQIGPFDSQDETLSIAAGFYVQVEEDEIRRLQPIQAEEFSTVENPILGLAIQLGAQPKTTYRLDRYLSRRYPLPSEPAGLRSVFIPANGLMGIAELWDGITLSDLEKDVLDSLRVIAPEVERVNLVGSQERERIAKVRITGQIEPIPLRSLGEGMNRMFGVALSLVNAKDGILLIDEVESGLHYSVQPELWRFIFLEARRLNVQVFATTHSWDCIEGFQQAAQGTEKADRLLIRLGRKKGDVIATLFDEQELAVVTREQIEVR